MRLSSGQQIAELVADDRPTAVLAYPPNFVFSCVQELAEWADLDRAGVVEVVLVLTQQPTKGEVSALKLRRLDYAGVLVHARNVPREFLLEDGALVHEYAWGEAGSGILQAVRDRKARGQLGSAATTMSANSRTGTHRITAP